MCHDNLQIFCATQKSFLHKKGCSEPPCQVAPLPARTRPVNYATTIQRSLWASAWKMQFAMSTRSSVQHCWERTFLSLNKPKSIILWWMNWMGRPTRVSFIYPAVVHLKFVIYSCSSRKATFSQIERYIRRSLIQGCLIFCLKINYDIGWNTQTELGSYSIDFNDISAFMTLCNWLQITSKSYREIKEPKINFCIYDKCCLILIILHSAKVVWVPTRSLAFHWLFSRPVQPKKWGY